MADRTVAMKEDFHFRSGCIDDAVMMVEKYHYSKRAPSNIQFIGSLHKAGGLFGDYGEMIAAAFFSIPPTRWSEDVLELSRLVRNDVEIPLTMLLSKCMQIMKRKCDLIVSFADATVGHHGGIYQAASWNYAGQREPRMDGVLINGTFIPGRSANSRFGTQSPKRLKDIFGIIAEPHFDAGKHLYWKALNKSGKRKAQRLGLLQLPYPKPAQEPML